MLRISTNHKKFTVLSSYIYSTSLLLYCISPSFNILLSLTKGKKRNKSEKIVIILYINNKLNRHNIYL